MTYRIMFTIIAGLLTIPTMLYAQDRDFRAERIVLDDNGSDGTSNTMLIQTPIPLPQDVILTIPNPGAGAAEFLLVPPGSSGVWLHDGNAGTTPNTHFLGTTDSMALQIQVRGASGIVANSLILNENGSIQRDSGGIARGLNAVDMQIKRDVATQVASGSHSVVGGGMSNSIAFDASYATIAGGNSNTIGTFARYTTISGGSSNVIGSGTWYATIGGGDNNMVSGGTSTVGGGSDNMASGSTSTVGGGENNMASGDVSTVGGGRGDTASGEASTVSGGDGNIASGDFSTVGGGTRNTASGNYWSTVGGGIRNTASGDFSTVGGGTRNTASGNYWSTVGGGIRNTASGDWSTVGGGRGDTASGDWATVGGGESNMASGDVSTVGGGSYNTASREESTVSGGTDNTASGLGATISGGILNNAAGRNSAIPGGYGLTLDASADRSFGFLANEDRNNNMTISTSDVALFGNTNLWLANNNSSASQVRFYEANGTTGAFPGTTHYTSFEAPSLTDTIEYVLPSAAGSANDVLTIDNVTGDIVTLIWATPASPPSIGPDTDEVSRLEAKIKTLEEQLETQQRLLETQEKRYQDQENRMETLQVTMNSLLATPAEHVQSKENAGLQSAE